MRHCNNASVKSDELLLPSCTSCIDCYHSYCKTQATLTHFVIVFYAAHVGVHTVVPGSAVLHVDVRTLPGQDKHYVLHHVKKALSGLRNADGTEYVCKVLLLRYTLLVANTFVHGCTLHSVDACMCTVPTQLRSM
jgi:acetylornithine deacetylase/succinyl-diaminopimelate desuccinylase-like protein